MFLVMLGATLLLAIIGVIIWTISTYNQFITLSERVTNGKAQIATQIESRWEVVQSLIQATKQYETYEVETLESIVSKRVSVSQDSSVQQLTDTENQLDHVIGRLIAISEEYPDLKASDVYENTMNKIDKYENNVRHARMIYNDVVTKFNRLVRMFPSNLVASVFRFTVREYFEGTASKQDMPSWE